MFKNISFALTLLVLFASVQASDMCSTYQQAECQSNNSCKWVTKPEQECQSPTQCQNLKEVDCYASRLSCKWNQVQASTCTVNSTHCTQDTTCADTTNCYVIAPTVATCKVKGTGFGCSKITDQTQCTQECSWATSYCSVQPKTCETIASFNLCNKNLNCESVIDMCILSSDAKATCMDIQGEQDCKNAGCVFTTYCDAPTQCAKPQPGQQCSSICKPLAQYCRTKQGVCNLDQQKCTDNTSCQWVTNPICYDNPTFCNDPTNCDKQFCLYTAAQPQTCGPKQSNTCTSKTDQNSCTQVDYCQFNSEVAAQCSSIQSSCKIYGDQNQCNVQTGCQWLSISDCEDGSSLLSFAIVIMSIILLI